MRKAPGYVIISLVFFIITGVGFAYSCFFYPNDHPVDCAVKKITGKDCPSCGFSRAFSYYTHFQFKEGKKFNALSWLVFLFFLFQFFLRAGIVLFYLKAKKQPRTLFIKTEIIISISFFLLAFLPLILKL